MAYLTFEPEGRVVHVKSGISVLQAARLNRIPIRTRCHGQASCLMCKVQVMDERSKAGLSAPNEREERRLGNQLTQGLRLACQTIVHGDAVVTIPEDPLKAIVRARLAKKEEEQEDLW